MDCRVKLGVLVKVPLDKFCFCIERLVFLFNYIPIQFLKCLLTFFINPYTVILSRSKCSCCGNCTCPVSKLGTPVRPFIHVLPVANRG